MKLITERTQVREVEQRWSQQYQKGSPYGQDADKQAIAKALRAIDTENATADDVAAIIGNRSWVRPSTCDECGELVGVAVEFCEEQEDGSRTTTLCRACLHNALLLCALSDL